jgi:hypothetical protein
VCSWGGFCVGSVGGVGMGVMGAVYFSWETWCGAEGKENGGGMGKEPKLGLEKYGEGIFREEGRVG